MNDGNEIDPGRTGPPEWFGAARDLLSEELRRSKDRLLFAPDFGARAVREPTTPVAGEIRALFDDERLDDPCVPMRVGVVLSVDAPGGYASVALVSEHTRMAGGTDVVLPPKRTGLPYEIMVETDVVGPVWFRQLGESLGAVDDQTLIGLNETQFTGVPAVQGAARGLPIAGPGDRRWGFKLAEAEALAGFTEPCMTQLVDTQGAAQSAAEGLAIGDTEATESDADQPLELQSEEQGREHENGR